MKNIRSLLALGASDIPDKGGALIAAGWTPSALRGAGWTPSALIAAGWTPSALRAAGWTPIALIAAGWTPSDLRGAGWTPSDLKELEASIPLVEKPYSRMLADIKAGIRKHDQSTFGPDADLGQNLCGSSMCTAGHLVNMGGELGYALKRKHGWSTAARLIHDKAHPGWPCQDFGSIPQAWAMAYIEEMAEREAAEAEAATVAP